MADNDKLISRKEAARYLEQIGCPRISVRTLESWASNGNQGKGPPFVKLRGKVGYSRSELDAWAYRNVVKVG